MFIPPLQSTWKPLHDKALCRDPLILRLALEFAIADDKFQGFFDCECAQGQIRLAINGCMEAGVTCNS